MPKFTNAMIEAAIGGFEAQKKEIDGQIAELRTMLTGGPAAATEPAASETPRKRKKFSAATLKRMKEAQQRRWANIKREPVAAEKAPKVKKAKRKISPEGRLRIIEATKRMWAAKRAAAEGAQKSAAKKK